MPGSAEVALRAIDALNVRNLEAFLDVMDPEIRIEGLLSQVEGAHIGHEGARAWWDRLLGTWPDWQIDVIEANERGEGVVLQIHISGHAAGSDTPLDQRVWVAARVRDGRCIWWNVPPDKESALRAVAAPSITDLIRRAHEAANARDLNAFLTVMSEDIHTDSRMASIEGGYRGHEGVRRWWAQLFDVFPDYSNEILEIEERGDGAIVKLRSLAHGALSDTPLEETVWQAFQVREGEISWWSIFASRDEAVGALQARQAAI